MFPYFLSIGMSADEYWFGDVWLAKGYHDAHKINMERHNQMLWMQGLYNYQGLSAALSNALSGFSKHKSKTKDYLKEPIRLTPLSAKEKQDKIEKERQKIIDYFTAVEHNSRRRNERNS